MSKVRNLWVWPVKATSIFVTFPMTGVVVRSNSMIPFEFSMRAK